MINESTYLTDPFDQLLEDDIDINSNNHSNNHSLYNDDNDDDNANKNNNENWKVISYVNKMNNLAEEKRNKTVQNKIGKQNNIL